MVILMALLEQDPDANTLAQKGENGTAEGLQKLEISSLYRSR